MDSNLESLLTEIFIALSLGVGSVYLFLKFVGKKLISQLFSKDFEKFKSDITKDIERYKIEREHSPFLDEIM